MYLFERAYVDYMARVQKFRDVLTSVSRRIWNWFWKGPARAPKSI